MTNKVQRVAILGATSQIARDYVSAAASDRLLNFTLFVRNKPALVAFLNSNGLADRCQVASFEEFSNNLQFDAIANFVGVGDPARAKEMGASIFSITRKYDDLALSYLDDHSDCRYIFLSSGAAYGASFREPVDNKSVASVPINDFHEDSYYSVAKLYAECLHRVRLDRSIIDIRVFNYFSRTLDLKTKFLVMDMVNAIKNDTEFVTDDRQVTRDFLTPSDFYQLMSACLKAPSGANLSLDAYSAAPVDKLVLARKLVEEFGMKLRIVDAIDSVNATGTKPHYYSTNKMAASLGFRPKLDSIGGVIKETKAILARQN